MPCGNRNFLKINKWELVELGTGALAGGWDNKRAKEPVSGRQKESESLGDREQEAMYK